MVHVPLRIKGWTAAVLLTLLVVTNRISCLPQTSRHRCFEVDPFGNNNDSQQYKYTVIVDPKNEEAVDNITCHPPDEGGSSSVPCKSLNYALLEFNMLSSVLFYLAAPRYTYSLNFSLTVADKHDIGFYGNNSLYPLIPMIKCGENVGLLFLNSSNIVLCDVQFLNCGAIRNSTSNKFTTSKSNATQFIAIKVALYIYNCTDVTMGRVQVLNSSQATGVIMYDTDGVVDIWSCTFAYNRVVISEDNRTQVGGGGFTIEFAYCKPGDSTCNMMEYDSHYRRNRGSVYTFDNCTFSKNVAHNPSSSGNYIMPSRANHDSTGRGGGLSLYFKGDAMNNSVDIIDSQFIANHALWGGGLRIEMSDSTINNLVTVSACNFIENHAIFAKNGKYTGGGGIHIVLTVHYLQKDDIDTSMRSKIQIMDSSFEHNQALEGGAICFAIARQNRAGADQLTEISVSNTTFEHNQARLGSAVMVLNFPLFNDGLSSEVDFYDCSFSNNVLQPTTEVLHPAGMAAIYVCEIRTSFLNSVTFYNNTGSALVIVGAQVNFNGSTAIFSNNSGLDGGAIAILGIATILIGPNTDMMFVNNTAFRYGGAIYNRYISFEDLKSNADCFLRYSEPFLDPPHWNVQFTFSGNKADQDGCSIFSTSVYPCLWSDNSHVDISQVFRWNEQWMYENSRCDEISTEPIYFNQSSSDPITVYPGLAFHLPLKAWDDFERDVTDDVVYSATMLDSLNQEPSHVAEVDPGYSYIASNYIRITGEPGNNITLILQSEGSRTMNVRLNLTILKCPPGFIQNQRVQFDGTETKSDAAGKRFKCECLPENSQYRGHLKCSSKQLRSKMDIKYWYGPVKTEKKSGKNTPVYLMGLRPFAYRATSQHSEFTVRNKYLPKDLGEVEEFICGRVNRRGVLCGKCLESYAVAVNSLTYECILCNGTSTTTKEFVKHLFAYIALTYVPIIIVFIVIIVFDVKLASSAAAGCLLFAQTVSSGYFDVTAYNLFDTSGHGSAPGPKVAQVIYTTVYGISNLESFAFLMHPFCLNKNFTTLHVLCLDYATAVFPLMVIATIYLVYRCKSKCNCCSRWRQKAAANNLELSSNSDSASSLRVRSSEQLSQHSTMPRNTLIHAFTAFLLLSYNKFSLASVGTIIIGELFDEAGVTRYHRVYLAGHLSLSDRDFLIPYGLIAIFVLIFIVLLPPLLLMGPVHFMDWLADKPKFSLIRKYWPSITIHIFLDTFQGYKPNRRFFVGLYLLFRLIMFLTFSLSEQLLTQYAIQQITIFVFTILVSLLKPYTNEFYNYLDTLLFLNLGILNALAIYTVEGSYSAGVFTFQCVLVFLPLVYIIVYILWNALKKRKHCCCDKSSASVNFTNRLFYRVIPSSLLTKTVTTRSEHDEQLIKNGDDTPRLFRDSVYYFSDDPDEVTFQRALKANCYQPSVRPP